MAALSAAVLVLAAAQALPVWSGLLQSVALPPLDLVADIRALLVYGSGGVAFVAALVLLVAVRAAVIALLLGGLTWERYLFALRFYLLVLPFAALAASFIYTAQATLFYGVFWAGLGLALILAVLAGPLPWLAPPTLRTSARHALGAGFRAGTVGAYVAALVALGAVAEAGGPVAAVVAVPVSAGLTWIVVNALRADPGFRLARRTVAVLPLAGIVGLVAVAITGPSGPPRAPYPDPPRSGSVMLMSGIDSSSGSGAMLEIDPNALGYPCDQAFYFSYAGPGTGQPQRDAVCQIDHGAPYQPDDTLRERDDVIAFLEEQAGSMPPPGVILGHSQGAWLLWEAAADERLPGVEVIVLVGPFVSGEVAYPAAGEDGPGQAGRFVLGHVSDFARPGGTTVFEPDSPLGREWLGHPDAIERTLARPLPSGIRALSIPSVFDLPLMPGRPDIPDAVDACPVPVIHPDLPYAAELHEAVVRFLDGEPQRPCPAWRQVVGWALRQFTAPPSAA